MPRRFIVSTVVVASLSVLSAVSSREARCASPWDEGISMAAAVSPDGRAIAIDLLGALWTLSIDGGNATRILEDGYDARMPVWSPDGREIAFVSDRTPRGRSRAA